MLCSDGLTDMMHSSEIEKFLSANVSASVAADKLIQIAIKNGGKDNVTVIVVDIPHNSLAEQAINKFMKRR